MTKQIRQRDHMQVPLGGSDWLFRRGDFSRRKDLDYDWAAVDKFLKVISSPSRSGDKRDVKRLLMETILAMDPKFPQVNLPSSRSQCYSDSERLAIQQQVWNDCRVYEGINASLRTLECGRPSSPEGKKGYRQRITYLFEQMEAIEAKYPFITNPLSKEWGNKLIAQYRYRRYTRRNK